MRTVIRRDRFAFFKITVTEANWEDFVGSGGKLSFLQIITGVFPMSTGDIVAMQVCQFQKDRDEKARRKFARVVSLDFRLVLSASSSANQVVKFFCMQHILCGRTRLLTAMQISTFNTHRVGAKGCFQQYRFSPSRILPCRVCNHCSKKSFVPYSALCVDAEG